MKKLRQIVESVNDVFRAIAKKTDPVHPGFANAMRYQNLAGAAEHYSKADTGVKSKLDQAMKDHSHYHDIHSMVHNAVPKPKLQVSTGWKIPSLQHFLATSSAVVQSRKAIVDEISKMNPDQDKLKKMDERHDQLMMHFHEHYTNKITKPRERDDFTDMWHDLAHDPGYLENLYHEHKHNWEGKS
jgi:hypothetical protein